MKIGSGFGEVGDALTPEVPNARALYNPIKALQPIVRDTLMVVLSAVSCITLPFLGEISLLLSISELLGEP